MAKMTIIEGNSSEKDNTRAYMVKGERGYGISSVAKTSTDVLVDTYTITFADGRTTTFTVTNGKGIVSIAKTSTSGLVDTYTVTFNDNTTTTFTVTNGKDGVDGVSPTVTTSKSGKTTTITITDKDGTHTATILDGEDGDVVTSKSLTLLSSGWTLNSNTNLYEYTVSDNTVTANHIVNGYMDLENQAKMVDGYIETAAGSYTFITSTAPTQNITLDVTKVVIF